MPEEKVGENPFGRLLKELLKKRSLSMRKLSQLTGIDTATISRIANNKQQAKPSHLQKFSNHLEVPLTELMKAAGYGIQPYESNKQTDFFYSIETLMETLVSSDFFDHKFTLEKIYQELDKYEQFALTKEGELLIMKEFTHKVEQVRGAGPFINELNKMYKNFSTKAQSTEKRKIIGSVLLYFILSTDIIPDYVFPFGYLDDCLAVQIGLDRLSKLEKKNENK